MSGSLVMGSIPIWVYNPGCRSKVLSVLFCVFEFRNLLALCKYH